MAKTKLLIKIVSLLCLINCIAYAFLYSYLTMPTNMVFPLNSRSVFSRDQQIKMTDGLRWLVVTGHNVAHDTMCDYSVVGEGELLDSGNNMILPSNITGAILWSHFAHGLTNQRQAMRNSITLAAKIRRPIIIVPSIRSRQTFSLAGKTLPWLHVPIERVYNVKFLISCLRKKGIAALYPCYPWSCVPEFTPPRLRQKDIEIGLNASLPFVEANFDTFFLTMPSTPHKPPDNIDDCITWSCETQRIGQSALENMKSITQQQNFSRIFGIHLRVEDEFLEHTAQKRKPRHNNDSTKLESILDEIITKALLCFEQAVRLTHSSDYWVYIGSAELKNSSKLLRISKHFPHVLTKEDLALDQLDVGLDVVAARDSVILEELSFFIGTWGSTYSLQVARNRQKKRLKSALYTLDTPYGCHNL